MRSMTFDSAEPLAILCLGAHSDDIEIGAGATLLSMADLFPAARVHWVVFCATGVRRSEAQSSAEFFTAGFESAEIQLLGLPDGRLPSVLDETKNHFESIKKAFEPDLIFTHYRGDLHQDHRVVSELTWQTFRNHLVLEYEIPKYDGDLGTPNFFQPVSAEVQAAKIDALREHFSSQKSKPWFDPTLFSSLMRLRGMECHSTSGFAEAFYCRKALLPLAK